MSQKLKHNLCSKLFLFIFGFVEIIGALRQASENSKFQTIEFNKYFVIKFSVGAAVSQLLLVCTSHHCEIHTASSLVNLICGTLRFGYKKQLFIWRFMIL